MAEQTFDVVVIGAGPAEVPAEARRVPGAAEAVRGDKRYEAERGAGALPPAA